MKPYHQRAGWRWLPGMLTQDGERIVAVITGDLCRYVAEDAPDPESDRDWMRDAIPDLTDSATQGAALAVLREVTGEPGLSFARAGLAGDATGGRWYMIASRRLADATMAIDAATEAEALHAALDRLIPE